MICSLGLCMALALAMAPQAEEGKKNDPYLASLKLEISTAKDTIDPVDLLQFTVRFTNTSDAPLRLELNRALPGRAIVHLIDPEGRTWRPVTLEMKGSTPSVILDLNAGEFAKFHGSYSLSFMRLQGARESFTLPQHGTWKVWAEYGRSAGLVKTNEATFQVKTNEAMSPKVRELFRSETWHRFAVGGEVKDADLIRFRAFVLSGVEEGQKDVMARQLGFRYLGASQPFQALEMFKAAFDSRLGNLDRVDATLCKAYGLWISNHLHLDEALTLLNQVETDPKDVVRRRVEEMRAGILKAKRKPEGK